MENLHRFGMLRALQDSNLAGKVRSVYKGKVSQAEIRKYELAKKYRAKYRKLLSQVKKQIRFLRSALRGKDTV